MHSYANRTPAAGRLRLLATLALCTAALALLAVLPTVPAQASTPSVTAPPSAEVESLLGQTPLEKLNTEQLSEALSQLPAFEGLQAAPLQEALDKAIETLLGKGANVEELLGGGEAATLLREKLKEVLGLLEPELEALLGGNPQTKLTEALQAGGISELIGKLLSSSPEPQVLIAQILSALNPERLQTLLGSVLSGEPFSKTTVEGLAGQLGTTPQTLAEDLGKSPEELPGTAMALTAPLKNGETLGVLNGVGGVTLGLIKGTGETVGSTGGIGGPGGSGPGSSTVMVVSSPTPASQAGVAAGKAGKLRVISHKVKGERATIVLEVPSAGKLSVAGRGLRKIQRETAKAERVTIHPGLTRAGISSLRKHHRSLKVPIKVSFKQAGGPSSSASVPLLFH